MQFSLTIITRSPARMPSARSASAVPLDRAIEFAIGQGRAVVDQRRAIRRRRDMRDPSPGGCGRQAVKDCGYCGLQLTASPMTPPACQGP